MMLMMDDAVVAEKAESVEKEHSALAREIEFRLTPYLYQLGIPPHVTGYCYLRSAVVEFYSIRRRCGRSPKRFTRGLLWSMVRRSVRWSARFAMRLRRHGTTAACAA